MAAQAAQDTKKMPDYEMFDPEGKGYDYKTAKSGGLGPDGTGENKGHWGSVTMASEADKKKFGLPDESYILLKGKSHETWEKAVKGEQDRGFEIKKYGNRYYSIPANEKNPKDKTGYNGQPDDPLEPNTIIEENVLGMKVIKAGTDLAKRGYKAGKEFYNKSNMKK